MNATQIIQQAVRTEVANALAAATTPVLKYGTVASLTASAINVTLDGDTATTPCVACCAAQTGDRVVVTIHNHSALCTSIIGSACPVPVGWYAWTSEADDVPPQMWPGTTWERIEGRFLLGATTSSSTGGNTYPAGATGGEAAHVLTLQEEAPHSHRFRSPLATYTSSASGGNFNAFGTAGWVGSDTIGINSTADTGEGAAHNNMPPFIGAFCWHRLA